MLKELSMSYIILVPKTHKLDSVNHIGLLVFATSRIKLCPKYWLRDLKRVLPKVISPLQGAFIQGKDIHKIFLWHMKFLILSLKKRKGLIGIKLDMKKAYDRLSWQFVHKCFIDLGFHRDG